MFRFLPLSSVIFLFGCASMDLSSKPTHQPAVSVSRVVTSWERNPNALALTSQLQKSYSMNEVQVLRVGDEIKMTYLSDRLFGVAGEVLLPSAQVDLKPVLSAVKTYPDLILRIDSFTDTSGDAVKNTTHSEVRAQSIVHYLMGMGVKPDHLSFKGYGGEYPIISNETIEGRSLNRRIVITLRVPAAITPHTASH